MEIVVIATLLWSLFNVLLFWYCLSVAHHRGREREKELLKMVRSLENKLTAKDIGGYIALENHEAQKEAYEEAMNRRSDEIEAALERDRFLNGGRR